MCNCVYLACATDENGVALDYIAATCLIVMLEFIMFHTSNLAEMLSTLRTF
jgi:hypothetical protein